MQIHRDYSLENSGVKSDLNFSANPKQSQSNADIYNQMVVAAMQVAAEVNPFIKNLPVGVEVPTLSAVDWPKGHNVDIRPRLVDQKSGVSRLIDSGAQLSATKKLPGDKLDSSVRLVAVNGSQIQTYGIRNIELKIDTDT